MQHEEEKETESPSGGERFSGSDISSTAGTDVSRLRQVISILVSKSTSELLIWFPIFRYNIYLLFSLCLHVGSANDEDTDSDGDAEEQLTVNSKDTVVGLPKL